MKDKVIEKTKHSFKIIIEPLDDKNGDVDLDVCIQQLSSLEKILKKTAKKISAKHPIKLKLTQASKNSPFNATIDIVCSDYGKETILHNNFGQDLKRISDGTIGESGFLEFDILENYKHIAKFAARKNDRYKTTIIANDEAICLDENFAKNIDQFISQSEECVVSYEGELEQINLHNEANYFYIYPYTSPDKIKCLFPTDLCNEAIDGIGRKVCVSGRAIYNKNQNFPYLIEVKNIDLYQAEQDLPDWKDLFGIAPDATGSLLSEEFIRNLRNEWH